MTLAFGLLAWHSRHGGVGLSLYLLAIAWAWGGFLLAWKNDRSVPGQRIGSLVAWALAARLAACLSAPILEDDPWRYLWDGYQTVEHGSPYGRPPASEFSNESVPAEMRSVLDRINHPDLPTVYGPTAQLAFAASYLMAPGALWPWKAMLFAGDVLILFVLGRSRVRGALAFWGLCPLVLQSTFASAHVDGLAVGFTLGACWSVQRSAQGWAGAWFAAAVCTRPHALILAPWVLGRSLRAWTAFCGVSALVCIPFFIQGGMVPEPEILDQLRQWEFNPSVFGLVASWVDSPWAHRICLALFVLIWLRLAWTRLTGAAQESPSSLQHIPGAPLFGALWLLSPVVNPWYLLWMAPFVAVQPAAWSVTALAAVALSYVTGLRLGDGSLGNFEHPFWLRPIEYGAVALAFLWTLLRHRAARLKGLPVVGPKASA